MGILNNPDTRIPLVHFTIPFCLALAIPVVALRFWVRWRRVKLWKDDWWILISLICTIGLSIILLALVPFGYGSHVEDINPNVNVQTGLKLLIVGQLFYFTGIGLIKISILLFCLRIDQWMRKPVYCIMTFVVCLTIATDIGTIFQCTPVNYAWDMSIPGGYCFDRSKFWEALAYLNIISDLVIYFLPVRTLYKIRMPARQRIVLVFIFAMGMFVILTEVFRLRTLKAPGKSKDPMWDNVPCSLWSLVECTVGILCASLPSLKPMFARFLGIGETDSHPRQNEVPDMTSVYFDTIDETKDQALNANRRRIGSFAHGHDRAMAEPGYLDPLSMGRKMTNCSTDSGSWTGRSSSGGLIGDDGVVRYPPNAHVKSTDGEGRSRSTDPDEDNLRWVVHSL